MSSRAQLAVVSIPLSVFVSSLVVVPAPAHADARRPPVTRTWSAASTWTGWHPLQRVMDHHRSTSATCRSASPSSAPGANEGLIALAFSWEHATHVGRKPHSRGPSDRSVQERSKLGEFRHVPPAGR